MKVIQKVKQKVTNIFQANQLFFFFLIFFQLFRMQIAKGEKIIDQRVYTQGNQTVTTTVSTFDESEEEEGQNEEDNLEETLSRQQELERVVLEKQKQAEELEKRISRLENPPKKPTKMGSIRSIKKKSIPFSKKIRKNSRQRH